MIVVIGIACFVAGLLAGGLVMRAMCNHAFCKDLDDLNARIRTITEPPKDANR